MRPSAAACRAAPLSSPGPHNTTRLDTTLGYHDLASGFHADTGFIPQVGYRSGSAGAGWTVRPSGFLRRQRTFSRRSGVLTGAILFAYEINWQSVLFIGYGDDRTTDDVHVLAPTGRQVFIKTSYALQR
jgi:hypothetical protein